jgi:hypothetical protein
MPAQNPFWNNVIYQGRFGRDESVNGYHLDTDLKDAASVALWNHYADLKAGHSLLVMRLKNLLKLIKES